MYMYAGHPCLEECEVCIMVCRPSGTVYVHVGHEVCRPSGTMYVHVHVGHEVCRTC